MTTYPWSRFWVRRSGNLDLSDGGYFVDPEEHNIFSPAVDTLTLSDLTKIPCIALLGEPGIGKSTALGSLVTAAAGTPHSAVDLSAFASDALLRDEVFGSPAFRAWASASSGEFTLFLDGLDECLLNIPSASQLLLHELRKAPAKRLYLRIACRTADWPELLTTGLRELWSDHYEELELAPLRRKDVRTAAIAHGLDADAFLTEVRRLEMVPLAIRPITLELLLLQFRDSHTLTATAPALYEKGCRALVSEWSQSRLASRATGNLTIDQRLQIASRIAAVSLLASKPTVFVGPAMASTVSDVSADALVFGTVDMNGTAVTREDVLEVLDTGLFSGRAGPRLGFSHWTFAEFLTARFCATLDDNQLAQLFLTPGVDGRDRVIPQLREVAGWLLPSHEPLRARIIAGDPLAALHGGLADCDAAARSAATDSLLSLAAAGQLADLNLDLRRRYRLLKHDGIAGQVRPFILDRTIGVVPRRMAIDIAEACDSDAVAEDLLAVVLDASEDSYMRSQAAHAVAQMGNDAQKARMSPLLNTTPAEDPDDELLGFALTALWPKHITPSDLFERHLTPAPAGQPSWFLRGLPLPPPRHSHRGSASGRTSLG